jgi:hypothetical protein
VNLHWISLDTSTGREISGVFLEDLDDDALAGAACVECGRQPSRRAGQSKGCPRRWSDLGALLRARAHEMICVAQGPYGPLFACRWGCPDTDPSGRPADITGMLLLLEDTGGAK